MKLGILTLPLRHNYGGILQAYALVTALNRLGHEGHLIRLAPPEASLKRIVIHRFKSCIKSILGRTSERLHSRRQLNTVVCKELNRFVKDNFPNQTDLIQDLGDLNRLDRLELYDGYIVGSDQVWRSEYALQFLPAFFCSFTDRKIKRISYAASFGNSEWNPPNSMRESIQQGIELFSHISVREQSAVKLCRDSLGVDARVVLDPTMLLNRSDYTALIKSKPPAIHNGLFEYFLDRNPFKEALSKQIQATTGYHPFSLDRPAPTNQVPLKMLAMASIEDWINGFEQASHVVTDSFHGCVFSILFNKPFTVVANPYRGIDRFYSLLERFDLMNRIIFEDQDPKPTSTDPNWEHVNHKVSEWREKSFAFLSEALSSPVNSTASENR